MEIRKPTDADKDWFLSLVPNDPRVDVKPMFGNLGAFVNGNMFMGLYGADVGVRLDDDAVAELATISGAGEFGPADRPMKNYLSLPAAWRDTPVEAALWVQRALDHVAAMPPKKAKAKGKDAAGERA